MQALLGQPFCSRQTMRHVHRECQHNRTYVTLWCRKSLQGEGMVLPFDPMTLTFSDLHYFVEIPKVGQSSTADRPMHTLWAPSSRQQQIPTGHNPAVVVHPGSKTAVWQICLTCNYLGWSPQAII